MRNEALFINGVFEEVLEDIWAVQRYLPEQILYLQPYKSMRIKMLAENPPTVDDQVRVFLSVVMDLHKIYFTGELVGWYDKTKLKASEINAMEKIIYACQPTEPGVYMSVKGIKCKNLMLVRRMKKLSQPFSVTELIKIEDNEPLSLNRTRPGGWAYIKNPEKAWLEKFI